MKTWCVLHIAVLGLILVAIAVVSGSVWIINSDKEIPDGIIALGSAAVGALSTLMTTRGIEGPPK